MSCLLLRGLRSKVYGLWSVFHSPWSLSFLSAALFAGTAGSAFSQSETIPQRSRPPAPLDAVTVGVQSAVRVLLTNGVAIDTNAARRAAILAVAAVSDPLARLYSAGEVAGIAEEDDSATNGTARRSIELCEKWPGRILYAKFGGLYAGTGLEVIERLSGATNGGAAGVILDMRGAGGRGMDCVEAVAGLFVGDGRAIFSISRGNGSEVENRNAGRGARLLGPAVFLIDENTSAAAELLVAVVKGGFEVLLVGRATRGDPMMREKIPLSCGDVLYVGTRRLTPLIGEVYGPLGVRPDIFVDAAVHVAAGGEEGVNALRPAVEKGVAREETAILDALAEKTRGDPILQRAVDVLIGLRTLDTRALKLKPKGVEH